MRYKKREIMKFLVDAGSNKNYAQPRHVKYPTLNEKSFYVKPLTNLLRGVDELVSKNLSKIKSIHLDGDPVQAAQAASSKGVRINNGCLQPCYRCSSISGQ